MEKGASQVNIQPLDQVMADICEKVSGQVEAGLRKVAETVASQPSQVDRKKMQALELIAANVGNTQLSDSQFRALVGTTLKR